jgi:hypothetical protein
MALDIDADERADKILTMGPELILLNQFLFLSFIGGSHVHASSLLTASAGL